MDPAWERTDGRRWPRHLHPVFVAISRVMAGRRLAPDMLSELPASAGSILPDHRVTVSHVSATEARWKRGHYLVNIVGPAIDGRWRFRSGQLERLATLSSSEQPQKQLRAARQTSSKGHHWRLTLRTHGTTCSNFDQVQMVGSGADRPQRVKGRALAVGYLPASSPALRCGRRRCPAAAILDRSPAVATAHPSRADRAADGEPAHAAILPD